jgi:ribosomal-protein-serine acetyltransferase
MFTFRLGDDQELRLIEERHTDALFALVQENHARLRAWVPWLSHVATPESTRQFIKRRLQRMADNNGWTSGIWSGSELVGEIGFD